MAIALPQPRAYLPAVKITGRYRPIAGDMTSVTSLTVEGIDYTDMVQQLIEATPFESVLTSVSKIGTRST